MLLIFLLSILIYVCKRSHLASVYHDIGSEVCSPVSIVKHHDVDVTKRGVYHIVDENIISNVLYLISITNLHQDFCNEHLA